MKSLFTYIALTMLFISNLRDCHAQTQDSLIRLISTDWQGTPYKYGGTSKRGTDCSGLVGFVYDSVFHTQLPRSSGSMYVNSEKLHPAQWSYGDLVFFEIRRGKVSHVGIYLCDGYFLHASTSKGVRVDHLSQEYYRNRLKAIARPTGFNHLK